MDARRNQLAQHLAEGLARGRADSAPFREAGTPEPERAADAVLRAAEQPDLAAALPHWVGALLASPEPAQAADALARLAAAARDADTPLQLHEAPQLAAVVAASPFLARLLRRHPTWWRVLRGDPPAAPDLDPPTDWDGLRAVKYRGLLRIVARDFAKRPFHQGLYELSDLADLCLGAALDLVAREQEASPPALLALLALGKLGGRELNFSSDVDVLFLEDPAVDDDPRVVHEAATRAVRAFKRGLEARTPDGFGYRVDLDLRPEGRTGVLTNSVDAALSYYESFGAEWERQMLIRLRPLAGPEKISRVFCEAVRPFVYRRSVSPDALAGVREMKDRIERERRAAGRDLEYDLKEGPGGIRDVEFLVQALQLFHGGRDARLRSGNVIETLRALGEADLLLAETVESLTQGYLWLRRAEHAVQLAEERQSARFPRDELAQLQLARRMAYRMLPGEEARRSLLSDRDRVRGTVRHHFEALVLGPSS